MKQANVMWPLVRIALWLLFIWSLGGFVLGYVWDMISGLGHGGVIFVGLSLIHGVGTGLLQGLWGIINRKTTFSMLENTVWGLSVALLLILVFGYWRSLDSTRDAMALACPFVNSVVLGYVAATVLYRVEMQS